MANSNFIEVNIIELLSHCKLNDDDDDDNDDDDDDDFI
jgi:hypothetical protein